MPTITATPGGGMYISTQVNLLAFGGQGAISHIDMTFSSGGTLFSRFSNKNAKSANLPAGLRHNVNLMLLSVKGSGYTSYEK